jgi:pyrroloquinoline quinone biosynthesis protein B
MLTAHLLGNAQDAGLPQAGCACGNCRAAWADPALRRYATALGLLDTDTHEWFLIDATPDFREQLRLMHTIHETARLAGILITHAHIGHYTGLMHLGYEAMAARAWPLYGTARFLDFMRAHAPWRQLVDLGNVTLTELEPGAWHPLTPHLSVKPMLVPHRDEWSDTVGYLVRGPARQLLYLPDIDGWPQWQLPARETIAEAHIALVDGSFFSAAELPGRDLTQIGHPLVQDSVARFTPLTARTAIYFTHLNHSNPLHCPSPERVWIEAQGFHVAAQGEQWEL